MDNFSHDSLEPVEAVKSLASTVKNKAKAVRDKAKAKEAQKVSDSGQYFTLRPYLKSLIPIPQYIIDAVKDKGISEYAVLQLPEQGSNSSMTQIINELKKMSTDPAIPGSAFLEFRTAWIESLPYSGNIQDETNMTINKSGVPGAATVVNDDSNVATKVKNSMPYILIAFALIAVVYFITKTK